MYRQFSKIFSMSNPPFSVISFLYSWSRTEEIAGIWNNILIATFWPELFLFRMTLEHSKWIAWDWFIQNSHG